MEEDYRLASRKFWQTIRCLRKGKQSSTNSVYGGGGGSRALGVDEIHPEYLKSMDVVGLSWLTRLCSMAWQSGTVSNFKEEAIPKCFVWSQ